ncbi:MAG: hypothetical protein ABIS17_11685 [Casimicrobiaceae bacterium]
MARSYGATAARQRGWAGLLLLLVALVIVGFLVRTAANQLGATVRPETPAITRSTGDASTPGEAGALTAPIDRARGVEAEGLRRKNDLDERVRRDTQ